MSANSEPTALDLLCAHVPFHDADPAQRAAVLRRLADTELFALLVAEPAGDQAELRMLDLPGGQAALASDDAAQLAAYLGGPIAHVAMPGRILARELAEVGQGLLVNPGRPSEMLLDHAALAWLTSALESRPEAADAKVQSLTSPTPEAVERFAGPLAERLADMAGLVAGAALVGVQWSDGRRGHLVAVDGANDDSRPAIAKALSELIAFLPEIDGGMDVTFEPLWLPPGAVQIEAIAPEQHTPEQPNPEPPKPDAPPRLRW